MNYPSFSYKIAVAQGDFILQEDERHVSQLPIWINHLPRCVDNSMHFTEIFILRCKGIIEKNAYEHHVYELVDDKSLSSATSNETMESKT